MKELCLKETHYIAGAYTDSQGSVVNVPCWNIPFKYYDKIDQYHTDYFSEKISYYGFILFPIANDIPMEYVQQYHENYFTVYGKA